MNYNYEIFVRIYPLKLRPGTSKDKSYEQSFLAFKRAPKVKTAKWWKDREGECDHISHLMQECHKVKIAMAVIWT